MKTKKILLLVALLGSTLLSACASVPMASKEDDTQKKKFDPPADGTAGLYIYRNSSFGGALKKDVFIDGKKIGETAPMVYFYKQVAPGEHKLSTESEFSDNDLVVNTDAGKNYFVRQYIKLGVFVGGAGLELIKEDEGQKGVLECNLAQEMGDSNPQTSDNKSAAAE